MSAYIVAEGVVRNKEALAQYGPQATTLIKQFGGEILAFGPLELIFGEKAYDNAMIVRFPDKEAALAWYNAPAYQDLLELRSAALDCRFRLVVGQAAAKPLSLG